MNWLQRQAAALFGLGAGTAQAIPAPAEGRASRTRPSWMPLGGASVAVDDATDYKMLATLRDNVPLLRRAISNYCALVGDLEVTAEDAFKAEIVEFLDAVRSGQFSYGYRRAQDAQIRNMLTYGKGVLEIVPTNAGDGLYALCPLESSSIKFKPADGDASSLRLRVYQTQVGQDVELDPRWLSIVLNDPETDPQGVSLLKALPFVGQIYLAMENALGKTWERLGVPSYSVVWRPPDGFHDPTGESTRAIMEGFEDSFTAAMAARKSGKVRDFFASGDVDIKVIGADGQELSFVEPARALMEQVVSATGQPPWMLGLSWSTTERLSDNQADMLTSTVKGLQQALLPEWRRIIEMWRDMSGRSGDFELAFDSVNLYDEEATARADAASADAMLKREEAARKLWTTGIYTQEQYAEAVLGDEWSGEIATAMDEPPAAPAPVAPADGEDAQDTPGGGGGRRPFHAFRCTCAECDGVRFVDAPANIGGGEKPKTRQIAKAIRDFHTDILDGWDALQDSVWEFLGLPVVTFAAYEATPSRWTPRQQAQFEEAVDKFLRLLYGANMRSKADFVSAETGDGLYQQHMRLVWSIGLRRAADLAGKAEPLLNPARDEASFQAFLGQAFDRLSDNGRARIGHQLDELREVMAGAVADNLNPMDLAQTLGKSFEGYRGYEWERLARTEVAFAQNAGQMSEFVAEGFDATDVASDAPPWHPNCLCALTVDPDSNRVLYDISAIACPICQGYKGQRSA